MRKIVITFNSGSKIQRLKKIMKDVYQNTLSDNLKLAKFNLNKLFIPAKVEEVEIEIIKIMGSNIVVTVPKSSLTFLSTTAPFDQVESTCEIEGSYIVLPWNIDTIAGKHDLKQLINKISTSTTAIKYTVNVSTDEGTSALDCLSQAELSLSENSFEDNTEELFSRIRSLEEHLRLANQNLQIANSEVSEQQHLIRQKDQQIINFGSQINNLTTQVTNLNTEVNQKQTQVNNLTSQVSTLSGQVSGLQSTNYSYSTQLASFNNSKNLVTLESSNEDRQAHRLSYVYKLTNYTGKVNVLVTRRMVGGIGVENVPFFIPFGAHITFDKIG